MERLKVKHYSGDERLSELLLDSKCETPLGTVKAMLLGAQSSAENFDLSNAIRELFPAAQGGRIKEELASELEGLWYHLAGITACPPGGHMRMPEGRDRNDFIAHVGAQLDAAEMFIKYLHYGGTEEFFGNERLEKVYKIYCAHLEILRTLKSSMAEKWGDEDFRDPDSLAEKIDRFMRVVWDAMVLIKEMVKKEKLVRMNNRSIIAEIEKKVGQRIRRNDPCPCGSGKKYKSCCGSR